MFSLALKRMGIFLRGSGREVDMQSKIIEVVSLVSGARRYTALSR